VKTLLIVFALVIALFFALFIWGLCKIAGDADDRMERILKRRREEVDKND
jgi:hypothetical protein